VNPKFICEDGLTNLPHPILEDPNAVFQPSARCLKRTVVGKYSIPGIRSYVFSIEREDCERAMCSSLREKSLSWRQTFYFQFHYVLLPDDEKALD
jgi:hypothetical protein